MTELEEQTHMSFWSALKSPLIIGCDIINIPKSSLQIYKNKDMVAVNQDDLGKAVDYIPSLSTEGSVQVWGGPLTGKNKYVILALNYGKSTTDVDISFDKLPNFPKGSSFKARDVWAGKSLGSVKRNISFSDVRVHETKVVILS